jgi:hypothetical protein
MKSKHVIIIALLCIVANISVFSQHSIVTIFSEDGHRFWVIMDGVKKTPQAEVSVKLSDLKDEYIRVKIIFEDEKIKDINQTIATRDIDGKFTHSKYILRTSKGKKMVMRLHSYEPIVAEREAIETPSQTQQTTRIPTQAKETANPTIGIQVTDPDTGENIEFNLNMNIPDIQENLGVQMQIRTPDGNASTQTQMSTTQTNVTNIEEQIGNRVVTRPQQTQQQSHYVMPGYSGRIGCPWPMSNEDFQNAKQSISSKSFEDSKLTIAKQIISSNCLFCSQVKEIMSIFNFEDSRLEFAKFAYDFVFDIGNYYMVNDAFNFSSSIDELDEFIRKKR